MQSRTCSADDPRRGLDRVRRRGGGLRARPWPPSGPADGAGSHLVLPVSQSPLPAPSSNHDEGCPLNLTLGRRFFYCWPTVLRRRDDSGRDARRAAAVSAALPLPVADAAGLARPGLNPGIERLGVERSAVVAREFCAG